MSAPSPATPFWLSSTTLQIVTGRVHFAGSPGMTTVALAGLLLVGIALTQVLSGQAAITILSPIAITAAQQLNADPRTFTLAYVANHLGTAQGVYDYTLEYLKQRDLLNARSGFRPDSTFFFKREVSKTVVYDNLEMIHPDKRAELISQLEAKTGLTIHRISVEKVNLLTESATIIIYFFET